VGLSAPSSDFTVTGSPVTTSGTLGLNWNVAPTPDNTPNAIVKRDSVGVINAYQVRAAQFYTNTNVFGVSATSTTTGVYGQGLGEGVHGYSDGSNGIGVFGSSKKGTRRIEGEQTFPARSALL